MRRFPDPGQTMWAFAEFLWRTFLVGLALFAAPPLSVTPSVEQQILAFIGVTIWCYYDGTLLPGRWWGAVFEGSIWFVAAIQWLRALLYLSGELSELPQ